MISIQNILASEFNIQSSEIKKLAGYANTNYYVTSGNEKYILKEYKNEPEILDLIEDESRLLEILTAEIPSFFQKPVKSVSGNYIFITKDAPIILYRLLNYIDGDLLCNVNHTQTLFESFGSLLANMDTVLMKQKHLSIMARRYEWDILQIDLSIKHSKYITSSTDRKLVEYYHLQYNEHVRPLLAELRYSIIHSDANDFNVLVKDNKVTGIIDFGDSVYSLLVNELAIGITYGMFGKDDPIKWAVPIIKSYSKIIALDENEADILYYLVAARLCISVCNSAHAKTINSNNNYLTISEKPALELLRKWIMINPLLAAEEFRKAANIPSKISINQEIAIKNRWTYFSKAFSLSYDKPIKMDKAAFQYMYDNAGNTYLDLRNNIPHVGHCHPKVVKAGQRKMAQLNTNTRYLYDEITQYSKKLLAKFPDSLNKVFYVNSGSAASDLAIRLAQTHTNRTGLMVMEYGYHGNTSSSIDISHYKFSGKGGQGAKNNIIVAPIPFADHSISADKLENKNHTKILNFLESITDRQNSIAAFITEPIVSAAGQIMPSKRYIHEIYSFIRKQGGICISDEVQTGFGRLGTYFWGYEYAGVVPDIVILGKPIGNGHPVAAVVCTNEIAESFNNGMEFFSSFGGNPVSCAIALSVLEVLEEEKLAQNAREVGTYMIQQFNELRYKCKHIGEIRGLGLSLGIELIDDKQKNKPATILAAHLVNELKNRSILAGTDGPFNNVLKLKPPLCFTKENADQLMKEIYDIFGTSYLS